MLVSLPTETQESSCPELCCSQRREEGKFPEHYWNMVGGRGSVSHWVPKDCCRGGFIKTQVYLYSEGPEHQR